ncbi:MAG: AAA family ATPase [Actinophytocola sp.]|nr:AAA family ATPase [Actinophytocola sp.]
MARILRNGSGSSPQERTDRDVATTTLAERQDQLAAVEAGLCFGKIDNTDGSSTHIGRIGLFETDNDYEPLLIDWRAPAARPFYLATAASPLGVRRRRHLRTRLRKVVGIDDEVLDLDAEDAGADLGLAGETALLAALNRQRDDAMPDIVATIQAEQDEIIRADLSGVLVVQGGPGTGKTAVALHRAAYLLYEHRETLSSRGVLVLGPNETFLRYIGQVLPSLGETGVLLSTVDGMFPGARVRETESGAAAEIKGRAVMVDVLDAAVADRQRVPEGPVAVVADEERLTLRPEDCAVAREKARDTRRPHNLARRVFLDTMLDTLAEQAAGRLTSTVLDDVPEVAYAEDEDPDAVLLDARDVADIRAELARDVAVRRALDTLWPELTPQQVLGDLLTDRARLDSAADGLLSTDERAALLRTKPRRWTSGDIALLDELAELLGEDDTEEAERRARQEREQRAYAEGVLDVLNQDDEIADEERLRVADVLDSELLAEREQHRSQLTAVERARGDRNWTFGHVIVDEAQELTAMDWRMVMRRCPSRSMTLVGDIAQTGAAGGAVSWQRMLAPHVEGRWRLAELTVNYRAPAEIMTLAGDVLAEISPELTPPRSVRATGVEPWRHDLDPADGIAEGVRPLAKAERAEADGGTVAVVCPQRLQASLRTSVAGERVSVLTVERAKGLEFDSVIVVAPGEIAAASSRGLADLYVALTRATQRLGVVTTGEALPRCLGGVSASVSDG